MGFATAVRTCLSKFFTLGGRAARPEYWWFYLFVVLAGILASVIDGLIFGFEAEDTAGKHPLTLLVSFALFFPTLAAGWRRMHDIGRPGWNILLPQLVSLAGLSLLLVTVGVTGLIGADAPDGAGTPGLVAESILILTLLASIAAALVKLWWLTRPGDAGTNDYGPPPIR